MSVKGINTFSLRKGYDGIWSVGGYYTTKKANLTAADGRTQLAVKSTGVAGKNTKIFDNLTEMKQWLKSG